MTSVMLIGLIVGFQHALEADHVAAVSTMVAEEHSARRVLGHGVVWALGHMLTIVVCVVGALALGAEISEEFGHVMELAVGLLVAALGSRLIYRQIRHGTRITLHRHRDGVLHFHTHASALVSTKPHDAETASHPSHRAHGSLASLAIGMSHGVAGSAALLVFVVASTGDTAMAISYVIAFGLGSIVGMAALTGAIAMPLRSINRMRWAPDCIRIAAGCAAIVFGGGLAIDQLTPYLG